MIIDDAFFIRNLIKKTILKKPKKTTINGKTLEFEVIGECSDGQEGLFLCKKLNPDIITLDLNMPNINGLDMIKILQKEQPNIHIIVITSNKNKEMAEKILDLHCRFIQKPFQDHLLYQDLDEIAQLVNESKESVEIGKAAIENHHELKEKKVKKEDKKETEIKPVKTKKAQKVIETKQKPVNSLASKMSNSCATVKSSKPNNQSEDFSYFTEKDKKASNKRKGKIEEFIEEPIIEIEPNSIPIESYNLDENSEDIEFEFNEETIDCERSEQTVDFDESNEFIVEFEPIEQTVNCESDEKAELEFEKDDFDDFDEFGDFEISFDNIEKESDLEEEPIEDIVEEYTKEEDKYPLELSIEKEETFEEFEEFSKDDDLVFFVENEKVEDTISDDMKKHLDSNKDIDFNDMDENNDEYIRFSKNDMGENNEYMELLMSMSYSYNIEIGYKLDQLEAKRSIEENRQKQLNTKLEELKDPNLHSILRNQQEQTKLIEEIEAIESEKDEFDEFDDFEFDETTDFEFRETQNKTPKESSLIKSNNYNQNGYKIAPPVKNKYEVKQPLKDTEPIFIQPENIKKQEDKKRGPFFKLFKKKDKKKK